MFLTNTHMTLFDKNQAQPNLGLILALGALVWSGTYNSLAKGLTPFLSPMSLIVLSEALTAGFIILTFGLFPMLKKFVKMDAKTIWLSVVVGLLNSAVAPFFWFLGLAKTSAINASILGSADVLCVLVLSSFLLGERMTRTQGFGAFIVLLGVGVVNLWAAGTSLAVHEGDLLVLIGSLISGAGSVLFKKYLSHVMPELAILIRNFAGIFAVLFVSLFLRYSFVHEVQAFPMGKVLLLLAFTFFSRYLNLTFYYEALDRMSATALSVIQIATPLAGLVFAYLILGEMVHSYQLFGCMLIIGGLLVEQMSEQSIGKLQSPSMISGLLSHLHMGARAVHDPVQIVPKNV